MDESKELIFLLEDNKDMVSSILLNNYATYGKNIYFVGSYCNFKKVFKQIYNETQLFCILYDCIPDNKETIKGFINLYKQLTAYKKYIRSDIRNTILVPTLGFEYIILNMLYNFEYIHNDIVNKMMGIYDYNYIKSLYPNEKSVEKRNKKILNKLLDGQYHNVNKIKSENNKILGSFYKTNQKLKAEQLYVSFPLFDVSEKSYRNYLNTLGIQFTVKELKGILDMIYDFYSKSFGDYTEFNIPRLSQDMF